MQAIRRRSNYVDVWWPGSIFSFCSCLNSLMISPCNFYAASGAWCAYQWESFICFIFPPLAQVEAGCRMTRKFASSCSSMLATSGLSLRSCCRLKVIYRRCCWRWRRWRRRNCSNEALRLTFLCLPSSSSSLPCTQFQLSRSLALWKFQVKIYFHSNSFLFQRIVKVEKSKVTYGAHWTN